MRATSEVAENNRVKLTVEVDESEIEGALSSVVRSIGQSARIPGFRPGKVPRKVLEARMGGATALRSEALREALPDFYAQAVSETEIDPIASPEIDITSGEESGPVVFEATVEVRPSVSVAGYQGLTATIPSPELTDADVDSQIDRLRENDGELVDVERAVETGDVVSLDLKGADEEGNEVAAAEDYLYEVGSGVVIDELDEALVGTTTGETFVVTGTPAGGTQLTFDVKVGTVQEKKLPEVTDEWAAESSEFSTVAELRDDIADRMRKVKVVQAQMSLRDAALGSLADLVDDAEVPDVLVDAEVNERLHDLSHRLDAQKISIEQFLSATGQSGDELVASLRGDAHRAVKVDLGLRGVAAAEEMVITDQELDDELGRMAEQYGTTTDSIRGQLDQAGRTGEVKAALLKNKAATWLVENVAIVDEDGTAVDRTLLESNMADEADAADEDADTKEEK
jgi:trigger factor